MPNGFHPKSNIDQLHLLRNEGSRGLIGDCGESNFGVKKLCKK